MRRSGGFSSVHRSRAGTEFYLTQIVNILKPEAEKPRRISQNHELITTIIELALKIIRLMR